MVRVVFQPILSVIKNSTTELQNGPETTQGTMQKTGVDWLLIVSVYVLQTGCSEYTKYKSIE